MMPKKYILDFVQRPPATMRRASGMYLYDDSDKAYLDMCAGWGSNILGHNSAVLQKALLEQSKKLINAGPLYLNEEQLKAAEFLCESSGFQRCFFVNSGSDANENAIKLARKYGARHLRGAYEIISFKHAFHGRTLGMMAATPKAAWQKLFTPLPRGFLHAEATMESVESLYSSKTAAVIIEFIQGEGGVREMPDFFIKELYRFCKDKNILFIADEVQTGMGRTGTLFAYQQYDILPDIISLGKGLGGGYPVAAMLCREELNIFDYGDIGGTYNGQPLAMACVQAVLRELQEKDLLQRVNVLGHQLKTALHVLAKEKPSIGIQNIRGQGLMIAFDIAKDMAASNLAEIAFDKGLLINAVLPSSIRLLAPFIISEADIENFIRIFADAAEALLRKKN